MRRILLVAALTLGLTGCAALQQAADVGKTIVTGLTTSVTNPITPTMLYDMEVTVNAAVQGLVQYRRACLRHQVDSHCRGNIRVLQGYTRRIPPILKNLRAFVKNNDQVDARTAYNSLSQLIADFKAQAISMGVQ